MYVGLIYYISKFFMGLCLVLQFPAFLLGVEADALKEKLTR